VLPGNLILVLPSTVAAVAEPYGTAVFLAVVGLLVAICVLLSRTVDRLGIPIVLLFLVLGMLGGSEGIGNIVFNDFEVAVRLGTMALVLILLDGGLNTSFASVRQVLIPASLLSTVGVAATALLVALCARALGASWPEAMLLGAVVSSTDAAAVLATLRSGGVQLRSKLGRTIEVESCTNDPMAVILTTSLIEWLRADLSSVSRMLLLIPLQLIIGAGVGVGFGYLGLFLLKRVRLSTVGLYPALTLALAFISFGAATVVYGSGFLAVYTTALVLGNHPIPYRSGLTRIHDAMAWMSQIGMFLMLGLLVNPSQLLPVAGVGLGIGLFLAVVGRPLAVLPCLLPLGYSLRESVFVGWAGLRGAVPIILATFPVLAQVPGAEGIFNLVFFIVVVSSLVPGATIRPLTRRLGYEVPEKPTPSAVLEINATYPLHGEITSYFVDPSLAVAGAKLSEIEFPAGAAVVLIVRGEDLVAARGETVLEPDDHVYVFFRPSDRPYIELLFGRPETG
jgi:potassium/hydrogen antiporter